MNKLDNDREIAFVWSTITREVWWTEVSTRTRLLGKPITCNGICYAKLSSMLNSPDKSWKLITV